MSNLVPGDLAKKSRDLRNQEWPGCSIMNVMHLKVIGFFCGGGLIVLHFTVFRFVHVQSHFQPLPTKLIFGYFDCGSYQNLRGVSEPLQIWFAKSLGQLIWRQLLQGSRNLLWSLALQSGFGFLSDNVTCQYEKLTLLGQYFQDNATNQISSEFNPLLLVTSKGKSQVTCEQTLLTTAAKLHWMRHHPCWQDLLSKEKLKRWAICTGASVLERKFADSPWIQLF